MANRSGGRRSPARKGRGTAGPVLAGTLVGIVLTVACGALYLWLGNPPVAVTDKAALWEPLVSSVPLKSRSKAEAKPAPFPASEEVFESAAHTYRAQCAQCHGTPRQESAMGRAMLPHAQQFFTRRSAASRSVAQPAGELFWKTAFGIRRSGMPAYNRTLTNTQLWQLSLLLHSAGDELPNPVRAILDAGVPGPQPTMVEP